MQRLFHRRFSTTTSYGVVFDIDGVLLRGKKAIPGAANVLTTLENNQVPYMILTNGGGSLESDKAQWMSEILNKTVPKELVCLCHTPMQRLVATYKTKKVLVIGKKYENIRQVCSSYGFQNAVTADQMHELYPLLYPDIPPVAHSATSQQFQDKSSPFEAVFIMMDPLLWGRELQLIIDVVTSKHGIIGNPLTSTQQVPIYNAAYDFQYVAQHSQPRFGAGAFRISLEKLFHDMTGNTLHQTMFGKPQKASFQFVENRIDEIAQDFKKPLPEFIYHIGDNPATDIRGANEAGSRWKSVLTRTGVFQGTKDTVYPSDYTIDSVSDLIPTVLKI